MNVTIIKSISPIKNSCAFNQKMFIFWQKWINIGGELTENSILGSLCAYSFHYSDKEPTTPGVPKLDPMQQLTGPYVI